MRNNLLLGIDIGSTTVKLAALDGAGRVIFSRYTRHFTNIQETLADIFRAAQDELGDTPVRAMITGSGGLTVADWIGVPFIQEVVAVAKALSAARSEGIGNRLEVIGELPLKVTEPITSNLLSITSAEGGICDVAIEIGGEDAKILYFKGGLEQRMNGICAGGTGAFIDQMAALLQTDAAGLNDLAAGAKTIYPIAARCGVFAKSDVQPLINEGAAREDLAASIFQAVVAQTISGLACGKPIRGRVAFLGGPLHFLPELRKRFETVLKLGLDESVCPENSHLFAAIGAALGAVAVGTGSSRPELTISALLHNLEHNKTIRYEIARLAPLFKDENEYNGFINEHKADVEYSSLEDYEGPAFLGIDAGSTTTKLVLIGEAGELLFSHYTNNKGNPLRVVMDCLLEIYRKLPDSAYIARSCVTGYGEHLIKAALRVDIGEIETVAHYKAAAAFVPDVDFILDIGGQDMKCIRVKDGVIENVLLNEACSAGCGSFIETFAKSMGYTAAEYAALARFAKNPIDLGSRCTVFMNSRVKQAQKEGAEPADIAAGLAYSVIKNALQKVIKITDPADLGSRIVVQGGTFLNDAVLRAFEAVGERSAVRPAIAGLMGAYGAAIIAREAALRDNTVGTGSSREQSTICSADEITGLTIKTTQTRCKRCENNCALTINTFIEDAAVNLAAVGAESPESGMRAINNRPYEDPAMRANTVRPYGSNPGPSRRFVTGNRCERGAGGERAFGDLPNLFAYKYKRVFDYIPLDEASAPRGVVGLPRVLNMFENYPLWHTFFTDLGYSVKLSPPSSRAIYEKGMESMPSESVCYPAKLAHGHVTELIEAGCGLIFYPCVAYEKRERETPENHFNCPIVTSYPENIKNNVEDIREKGIDFRNPFLTLNDFDACARGLCSAFPEIPAGELRMALHKAWDEQARFRADVKAEGLRALNFIKERNLRGVVLAGRPYHIDPEINHGIPEMITGYGVAVLSEDSVADLGDGLLPPLAVRDQWMYHSRLYAAAAYVAQCGLDLVQLNSFGCGLDAVTTDEVQDILNKSGKIYTLLKIDEVNNLGSARIRIRSLFAALKERENKKNGYIVEDLTLQNLAKTPGLHSPNRVMFTKSMKKTHTILSPQMSPIHFRLVQEAFRSSGYNLHVLQDTGRDAIDVGLRYVNNDACYPALIVVGQIIKAIQSGEYDTDNLSVVMTQTGGGCRASNYVGFIRKALKKAGYPKIPVVSISAQGIEKNPGWHYSPSLLNRAVMALVLGDLLMRVLYRTRPYEREPGSAEALYEACNARAVQAVTSGKLSLYRDVCRGIVSNFDNLPLRDIQKPRVGVVGEILVKFHPIANNDIVRLLESEGAEAVVPDLVDFFQYSFYNSKYKHKYFGGPVMMRKATGLLINVIELYRRHMRRALAESKRFEPPKYIDELGRLAKPIVSLGNQTGEGWFLTAEMAELIESGTRNIVCTQPFACLPNHVTGKGIIKELRRVYPGSNIVAVDYDPGASEVNQLNRIKLMLSQAVNNME